ncbi:MAG: inovirus-type Gp2 protein, partial [Cycloclasticus sp.]|nr:inovirus-type Gp2 protein [Cycloclasticus sp.]
AAKSGLYVQILESMINQFEIAATKWKRVFVLRFDLHMENYRSDNKIITEFRKRLFQRLKRTYDFKDIGFCWVREQERAKSQHYHFVLFLDGDLIRHSSKINNMVKQAWERPEGGYTVPVIKHPFYFADSEEVTQDAIYRVSYLAKARGKGYRDKQAKDYQCSRMKQINNNQ